MPDDIFDLLFGDTEQHQLAGQILLGKRAGEKINIEFIGPSYRKIIRTAFLQV